MILLATSFLAGILTILAPCVLPVLPIIIGGSVAEKKADWRRAGLIILSLMLSIVVFTLLLKATTALLGVPQIVWQLISGAILLIIGLFYLVPKLWDKLLIGSNAALGSQQLFAKASAKGGLLGPVLVGAALGPVFSSCSPTYALIVATVLPVSFFEGIIYLFAYVLGLGLSLFILAYTGQHLIRKLRWSLNPEGWFRKAIGILFILIGILVIIGADKQLQASILESGLYAPIEQLEQNLPH